ncbi:MAG: hypothetical protein ACYC4K_09040 [Thiobacillus sp.]
MTLMDAIDERRRNIALKQKFDETIAELRDYFKHRKNHDIATDFSNNLAGRISSVDRLHNPIRQRG